MRMKCIIIEGPQGCGKTRLANYLREKIPASNLYRLSGQSDKTMEGFKKSKEMYEALLRYMKEIDKSEINLIFDRTFFSEQVYSLLGFKEYDFTPAYEELLKMLEDIDFDVYYISLYLKDKNLFKERLKRDHHNYQAFSIENSVNQQNVYKSLLPKIESLKNAHVFEIAMDDFDESYEEIDEIFGIEKSKQLEIK